MITGHNDDSNDERTKWQLFMARGHNGSSNDERTKWQCKGETVIVYIQMSIFNESSDEIIPGN